MNGMTTTMTRRRKETSLQIVPFNCYHTRKRARLVLILLLALLAALLVFSSIEFHGADAGRRSSNAPLERRQRRNVRVAAVSLQQPSTAVRNELVTKYDYKISWSNRSEFEEHALFAMFKDGHDLCELLQDLAVNETRRPIKVLVNVSLDCVDIFQNSILGTGNYLQGLYATRLVVEAANAGLLFNSSMSVDLQMQCIDKNATGTKALVLPAIMGEWTASADAKERYFSDITSARILQKGVCGNFNTMPIWRLLRQDIQRDLRRLAVDVVGGTNLQTPPAVEWLQQEQRALMQSRQESGEESKRQDDIPVTIDDAVIHFRCGDLMHSAHPSFGFLKFSTYSDLLWKSTTSIGIVTQPFPDALNTTSQLAATHIQNLVRGVERKGTITARRCQLVVGKFVEYLQHDFPDASIRVYNDPHQGETISRAFAHLIAGARNQVIVGISSFSVLPALASFAQVAHVRRPNYPKVPNQWLLQYEASIKNQTMAIRDEAQQHMPRLDLYDSPRLMARTVKTMWIQDPSGENVLRWFEDESCQSHDDNPELRTFTSCWRKATAA